MSDAVIVQKYGGTSVGTPERIQSIAKRISTLVASGVHRVAVVVSAMSGETNRLVALVNQVNPQADFRSYDVVVAAGEQVSVGLLCAALGAENISAVPLLAYQLGIITDELHGNARIQEIRTERIQRCWENRQVPVVAGFQGMNSLMEITTLGRGGSDTSAVALAVALKATLCEINTDVEGVYTADPRVVPAARLIETLDYEVALELSALGSKVLHSRCVELGAKYKLAIVVRHSFAANNDRSTRLVSLSENLSLESPLVSGVTLDKNVTKITLKNIDREKTNFIATLFTEIARQSINVDIIVYDRDGEKLSVGFTVATSEGRATQTAIEALLKSEKLSDVQMNEQKDLCKVSVVGLGMRSHPGVASRVFSELTKNGIELVMISTSEIKISCVVPAAEGELATNVLHSAFFS
jgi:aspartate kinase